eukprot:m51a1_g3652 hypothetical protein (334) ;mRNA; f:210009-211513
MVNLFYLSDDPAQAARWYADNHVTKMGLEAVQVLWTCVRLFGSPDALTKFPQDVPGGVPMRPLRNARHQLVLWAGQCAANYAVVAEYAGAVMGEYERRYGRPHARSPDARWLRGNAALAGYGGPAHAAWLREAAAWVASGRGQCGPRWWDVHGLPAGADPATCGRTEVVQCVKEECKVPGDAVQAYRNCYVAKFEDMKCMRYYRADPPEWFPEKIRKALIDARNAARSPKNSSKKRSTPSSDEDDDDEDSSESESESESEDEAPPKRPVAAAAAAAGNKKKQQQRKKAQKAASDDDDSPASDDDDDGDYAPKGRKKQQKKKAGASRKKQRKSL